MFIKVLNTIAVISFTLAFILMYCTEVNDMIYFGFFNALLGGVCLLLKWMLKNKENRFSHIVKEMENL